ncbi:hypothetical protein HRR80_000601 [Exophiala dermatitidis]|uniref:Uncharacterized protein n=1 Tax=Exophiala dermatitidis TaxID=5970 RepID=A0AAN6IZJ8_EXODE|nr:hypothetical protein HRR86_000550 [Exophiala dermatitidis]KAJ8995848.1 hypothetical protein HRR80_000601 [Exophiala dermatitidis]
MPAKLQLSDKQVSYSDVKDDESNVLHKLAAWDRRCKFFNQLYRNRTVIHTITAHHLGLNVQLCKIAEPEEWIYGSFNLWQLQSMHSGLHLQLEGTTNEKGYYSISTTV